MSRANILCGNVYERTGNNVKFGFKGQDISAGIRRFL